MLLSKIALLIIYQFIRLRPGGTASLAKSAGSITYRNYADDFENTSKILSLRRNSTQTDLFHHVFAELYLELLPFIGVKFGAPLKEQPKNISVNNSAKKNIFSESTTFLPRNASKIVFPDSNEHNSVVFPIDERKCGESTTFCEEIDTYPYEHLKIVLDKENKNKEFFGVDEGPIEHRIGEFGDNFICGSIEKTIFPKAGKNKYNKWKYIINQGDQDGYVQGVRIETCIKLDGPCNLLGSSPYGYVTSCKQKYIYRRMLSVSDSGTPFADTFQLPSACCCSYRRDADYLFNFGKKISPKS